ncbi:MAG: radical SAM protein [Casimicrobium sp.]
MMLVERKICWRVTRYCNLHCSHCLAGHGNALRADLDGSDREIALRVIVDSGVTRITWTGGEPTLCPDLPSLLSESHAHGIASVVTTHGLALRKNLLDSLDRQLDRIRISFDGLEATHNSIRGADVFAKALRAVVSAHADGYLVEANISVLDRNVGEIPELIQTLCAAGVSKIVLLNLLRRESAIDNMIDRPSIDSHLAMLHRVTVLQSEFPKVVIQQNDYWNVDDRYVVLESDGEIVLCSEVHDDMSFGSIIGPLGPHNLTMALKAQTLAHRTPLEPDR